MYIYLFNLISIMILGVLLLYAYKGLITKKLYFAIISLQLAFIAGLRGSNIGWDTNNYISYFNTASLLTFQQVMIGEFDIERGYIFFEYIISRISDHPSVLFLVIALIYIASTGYVIYKNSPEPILSYIVFIALGFFSFSMTSLRQTLALALIVISYQFVKKRKKLPFILLVSLASCFHITALIFLPAYFLAYKRLTKKYLITTILIALSVYLFRDIIFSFIDNLFVLNYSQLNTEGPTTLITLLSFVLIVGIIQSKKILESNKDNIILYNFAIVSITLSMLAFVHPAALRATYYYHIFSIIFIPTIITSFYKKEIKILLYFLGITLIISLYIFNLTKSDSLIPYYFFWQ